MLSSIPNGSEEPYCGNGTGELVSTLCSCGRPLAPIPGARTCLGDVIGKELARVRREQKRIDGFVPWYSTEQFKEAMEFRELMLPYIVTKSGQTVAECIVPQLAKNIELNPARLLQ